MAATKVSKAITDLKTDVDKLDPKPSIVFYNVHKLQSAAVVTAAKELDTMISGTDASGAPATLKTFTDAATKYFTNLGNVAAKENATIKVKLKTLVDAAEKEALAAGSSEVATFVKSMAGRPRSSGPVDPKPMEALKAHIELRKRGLKEVQNHHVVATKILDAVKANLTKGQAGLLNSQGLLKTLREAENKVSQGGDFLKGRVALDNVSSKALDNGPYPKDLVAKLRKEDGTVFDDGMRVMAEARDLRAEVVKVIGEHELELDKSASLNAKDENTQLSQLKKVETDLDVLTKDTSKVVVKLDKTTGWGKIDNMTKTNAEVAYKAKVEESLEAFRSLPALNTTLQNLSKRVELFRGKEASPKVTESINTIQSSMAKLRGQFKVAGLAITEFRKLVSECDLVWKERGGG